MRRPRRSAGVRSSGLPITEPTSRFFVAPMSTVSVPWMVLRMTEAAPQPLPTRGASLRIAARANHAAILNEAPGARRGSVW